MGADRRSGRLRVVLVDDTQDLRWLVRIALEADGHTVVGEAEDGRAGLELAATLQPDLVVLDVAMPVMDGLEALPLIRAALPGARIVMLSGFRRDLCAAAALATGADAYVEKGDLGLLLRTVEAVFEPPGDVAGQAATG